jgi:hypothetical protein
MIFRIVADEYSFMSEPYARAGYARVCGEWQSFFEERNFRRLVIGQDRISDLERILATNNRRDSVEHLFLRIRLSEYDCTVCQSAENTSTIRR